MARPKSNRLYAVYRDDDLLGLGTADELGNLLEIDPETVKWLSTPSARRRADENPSLMFAIRIEEEEDGPEEDS